MEAPKSGCFSTVFSALLRPYLRRLDKPSLARYQGRLALAGLRNAVRVRWDAFAIPHVSAADEIDLFFAQGFLHAQERLWQMELSRRFLQGRNAEIFGNLRLPWKELSYQFRDRTTVDLDYFMRLLGVAASADACLELLSESLRARLDAYCNGVNRYIDQCKKLPWEFRLLRHRPEVWRPQDTLTIGKGFALLLSTALYTRLNFLAVADKLKNRPDMLRDLLPGYPGSAPVIACAIGTHAGPLSSFANGVFAGAGAGGASNSWALGATRSQTGGALLCNDPHLRLTLPSIWYLMHLRSAQEAPDGYEVWGATIPGCPLVQIGRNRSIAWGITAAVCDDVEIYREKLHRLEPDRYLAGHDWNRLESRRELIAVRKSKAVERVVRRTRHGPVISDFSGVADAREILAVRWTAHEPSEEMRSLYGVNRASTWREFHESLRHHGAPSLNFVYADGAGNIGYALAGRIPARVSAPDLFPVPGWDKNNDWRGYIPFDQLPHLYNPTEGAVASANNGVTDAAYPYYLSRFFEPPHRFRRIGELLAAREKHSQRDMTAMQLDDLSLQAKELIASLKFGLEQIPGDEALQKAAAALLAWDGRCGENSIGAAVFHVFHHRLLANLLTPDLGEELFAAYVEILNQCIVPTDRILADAHSKWFAGRSRSELVALALRQACADIEKALGPEISSWRWGKIHTLHMNHSLGRIPFLSNLLGIGPLPAPGNGTTLNIGFYRHSNPYAQTVGASLRFFVDMSNAGSAEFILPSGQSGHPWSPHYADQTELWVKGKRINLAAEIDAKSTSAELLLEPVRSL
jgi:penicillin amidase